MPKWLHLFNPPEVHRITVNDSVYNQYNPYGFMFNVNHPAIAWAYAKFRKEIGEELYPISDADRYEFEKRVAEGYYPQLNKFLPR